MGEKGQSWVMPNRQLVLLVASFSILRYHCVITFHERSVLVVLLLSKVGNQQWHFNFSLVSAEETFLKHEKVALSSTGRQQQKTHFCHLIGKFNLLHAFPNQACSESKYWTSLIDVGTSFLTFVATKRDIPTSSRLCFIQDVCLQFLFWLQDAVGHGWLWLA